MDFSEMTTDKVLCSYSSVKGHRTRVEREIESLLKLLNVQYSSTTELRLNDRLEKLEKHSHKLLDISEYLISIKYPKASDHAEEVKEFMNALQQCSDQVFKILHERHAVAGAAAMAQLGAPLGAAAYQLGNCLLYTSPSPRDRQKSRMPSSA